MLFACSKPSTSWLAYVGPILSALVALMIGVGGLWIAHWQMRVAREKLNADLFDRRLKVFEAFRWMVARTLQGRVGEARPEEAIAEASAMLSMLNFLFNTQMKEVGNKLVHACSTLLALEHSVDAILETATAQREAALEKSFNARMRLTEEFRLLEDRFGPYLVLTSFVKPSGKRRWSMWIGRSLAVSAGNS